MAQVRVVFSRHEMATPQSLPHAMMILLLSPNQSKQQTLDDELADILEEFGYPELPTTVLFPHPFVGFDDHALTALPPGALDPTISSHRVMLQEWIMTNAQRKFGIEEARQQRGRRPVFRSIEIQIRHEMSHWSAMETNIDALRRNVDLMEKVKARTQFGDS